MRCKGRLEFIARLMAGLKRAEGCDTRSFDFVWHADNGGFYNSVVADQRGFDFHRPESVAGHVDDIVDAAHDPEVATIIPPCAIAREIHSLDAAEVGVDESFSIAMNAPQHRWPRLSHDQQTARIEWLLNTLVIHHRSIDPEEWQRA